MAKNVYRSAQGKIVDIDKLRLANEQTIAIGNMKTNARGDQLGPGGQVVKSRAEIMKEYYALNTNVAEEDDGTFEPPAPAVEPPVVEEVEKPAPAKLKTPVVDAVAETSDETTPAKKTSLADQVAKDLEDKGIQRI